MSKTLFYSLLIVLGASSYGILSTLVKLSMQNGFTTSQAVTSQYAVGFLLALIVFVLTQRKMPRFTIKGFSLIMISGFFTGLTGIVYGKCVEYFPASLAVVMLFQFTWIGLLIDCLVNKRKPKRIELISVAFLIVGTILAAGILDVDLTVLDWRGWVYGFASAISFAIFMQFNSKPVPNVTPIARMLVMAFFSLTIVTFFQSPEIMWDGTLFTTDLLYFGLALGLFGVVLPIICFSIAVPKVGGGIASILSAMELPVAIIASTAVLHEVLTAIQIGGIMLVLIGLTLPTLLQNRQEKKRQLNINLENRPL